MTEDKPKKGLQYKGKRIQFQTLSFTRLIPNLATVIALCLGLSAIRFALLGEFKFATVAILVAALFDAMDGRLARLLGAASDFGAELDSLSDFISFGVAPPVVIYILTLNEWSGFGWGLVLFFSVCMGLRLARFNTSRLNETPPEWTKRFFVGVPAPAGAFIILLPLSLYFATDMPFFIMPMNFALLLVLSGFLMVARLPTFSFKTAGIPRNRVPHALIIAGLLASAALSVPWILMSVIIIAYLGSIPFAYIMHKKLRQEEETQES